MSDLRELSPTDAEQALLVENGLPGVSTLENAVRGSLGGRLASQTGYSAAEIVEVSELDRALFPRTVPIPAESIETVRLLCAWSRCELRPAREIRSHRRILGPIIVFVKRLSWPFIRFHLKETFESIELFHSKLIYAHARQVFEIEQMKKKLPILP